MFKKTFFIFIIGLIAGLLILGATKSVGLKILHKIKHHFTAPRRFDAVAPCAAHDGIKIFAASSLDRIFLDGKTLSKPNFTESATISAASNEYESFQIVLQVGNRSLENVYLNLTDFKNEENKSSIDVSNITWRVEGYVSTIEPYYPVKYVGRWPDPLMPPQKTTISAKTTQPFWITVYVPSDSKAGVYKSIVTITADGIHPLQIPVTLKVYGFEIPQQNHLKTAFDFYGQNMRSRYLQQEREFPIQYQQRLNDLNDQFISTMIKYRQNPILNIDPTSQEDLSKLDRYLLYGLNNFAIGKKGGTFDNNWPKTDEEIEGFLPLYQNYGETLKLTKLLDYAYIYTWDEGDVGNPLVAKITSMIHRAYPGLKNMVCYHGFWDPDALPNWGKDIDIWCFNIDDFNENQMRRLQKNGIEMWMYVSGPKDLSAPNFILDTESMDYRILPWLCWKYDIKGLLYWCVNFWESVDPFENAKNTKWEQNANGLLFYPGPNGPIASLRSEIFRDGMEDYEYIQILFTNLKLMRERKLDKTHNKLFEDSVHLLTIDPSIAQSMTSFTKNQDVLQIRRDNIAKKIEEINKLLSTPH